MLATGETHSSFHQKSTKVHSEHGDGFGVDLFDSFLKHLDVFVSLELRKQRLMLLRQLVILFERLFERLVIAATNGKPLLEKLAIFQSAAKLVFLFEFALSF